MEDSKFFKWVWRINALSILGAVIISLSIATYSFIENITRTIPKKPLVKNLADDPQGKEKWVLSNSEIIRGSDYIFIRLISENNNIKARRARDTYNMFSGGISHSPAKNILFLNAAKNESSWMFGNNNQLITSIQQFPYSYDREENINTEVLFYGVIQNDTNGDGVKNIKDRVSFAISEYNGNNFKIIVKEIDRVISKSHVSNNRAFVIYQKDGVASSILIDLKKLQVISENELPKT